MAIFIIIPRQFYCDFYCCTGGISFANFIIILIIEHLINHAWVEAASKQTSTMPDVAVRWLHLLLGMLGGAKLGQEILYLGAAGSGTPIWDVLAPQGEQEWVLNHLKMGSISPCFPIWQAVPLGIPQALGCY